MTVKIGKTRTGSFSPSLLTPRRRIDVALYAVVMEAYVHGVSTRKVDDLVTALGAESGISKSEVSRICADLDTDVAAFNAEVNGVVHLVLALGAGEDVDQRTQPIQPQDGEAGSGQRAEVTTGALGPQQFHQRRGDRPLAEALPPA